jgi:membrane protease YdiL (CAAX protease family)
MSEEDAMLRQKLARFQLPIFFLLAYAITWSAQIPAYIYAHNNGYTLTNEQNTLHLINLVRGDLDPGLTPYLLAAIFAFGPTLAGVLVTGIFYGRVGLRDLWSRVTRVRVDGRWILIVLLLPVALGLVTLAVTFLAGGLRPINFVFLAPLSLLPLLLLYMLIFTGLAEEVGWRGYALPELQKSQTAERASWILGIGWGLWHIPALLFPQYLRGELNPGFVILVLLGITVGGVGWTIVITWIYNNTSSVFWIIVLHGWYNTVQSYLVLSAGLLANVIFAVLPWAVAVYLLRRYGGQTLRGKPVAIAAEPGRA